MEKYFYNDVNYVECGIDEAGRGPLFGYVYAAAVIWPNELEPDTNLIKDSKKLSKKKKKISFGMDTKKYSQYRYRLCY